MRDAGAEHDTANTHKFEQFAVGWKSVPAFVDPMHLNRPRVQVCFQQKFANPGPRAKRFAPEGSRESLVFLGRSQSDTSVVRNDPLWRASCTFSKGDRGDAPIPPLTRAKARLARTATPTSSFSVPVPA